MRPWRIFLLILCLPATLVAEPGTSLAFKAGLEADVLALFAPHGSQGFALDGWHMTGLSVGPDCAIRVAAAGPDGPLAAPIVVRSAAGGDFALSPPEGHATDPGLGRFIGALGALLNANDPGDFFAPRCVAITSEGDPAPRRPGPLPSLRLALALLLATLAGAALARAPSPRAARPPGTKADAARRRVLAALTLGLVAIAVGLRALLMTQAGPSGNELDAIERALGAFQRLVGYGAPHTWHLYHPPLHSLLLSAWSWLGVPFGLGGELSWLRLIHLPLAGATVALLARTGRHLGHAGAGLAAAALFACAPDLMLLSISAQNHLLELTLVTWFLERLAVQYAATPTNHHNPKKTQTPKRITEHPPSPSMEPVLSPVEGRGPGGEVCHDPTPHHRPPPPGGPTYNLRASELTPTPALPHQKRGGKTEALPLDGGEVRTAPMPLASLGLSAILAAWAGHLSWLVLAPGLAWALFAVARAGALRRALLLALLVAAAVVPVAGDLISGAASFWGASSSSVVGVEGQAAVAMRYGHLAPGDLQGARGAPLVRRAAELLADLGVGLSTWMISLLGLAALLARRPRGALFALCCVALHVAAGLQLSLLWTNHASLQPVLLLGTFIGLGLIHPARGGAEARRPFTSGAWIAGALVPLALALALGDAWRARGDSPSPIPTRTHAWHGLRVDLDAARRALLSPADRALPILLLDLPTVYAYVLCDDRSRLESIRACGAFNHAPASEGVMQRRRVGARIVLSPRLRPDGLNRLEPGCPELMARLAARPWSEGRFLAVIGAQYLHHDPRAPRCAAHARQLLTARCGAPSRARGLELWRCGEGL